MYKDMEGASHFSVGALLLFQSAELTVRWMQREEDLGITCLLPAKMGWPERTPAQEREQKLPKGETKRTGHQPYLD